MKRTFHILILTLCLLLTAGCWQSGGGPSDSKTGSVTGKKGNGEGYAGVVKFSAYQMDPTVACANGTSPGYRERIDQYEDGATSLVDACTGATTAIATPTEILANTVVAYQDGIYEIRPTPPDTTVDEAYYFGWCAATGTPTLGFLLSSTMLTGTVAATVYTGPPTGGAELEEPLPIGVETVRSWRLLRSLVTFPDDATTEPFTAAIAVTPQSMSRNLYGGRMRYLADERGMLCRVLSYLFPANRP